MIQEVSNQHFIQIQKNQNTYYPPNIKIIKKMCNVLLYVRSDLVEQNKRNPPQKN